MKFKVHTRYEPIRISGDHRIPNLFIHSYGLKTYQTCIPLVRQWITQKDKEIQKILLQKWQKMLSSNLDFDLSLK